MEPEEIDTKKRSWQFLSDNTQRALRRLKPPPYDTNDLDLLDLTKPPKRAKNTFTGPEAVENSHLGARNDIATETDARPLDLQLLDCNCVKNSLTILQTCEKEASNSISKPVDLSNNNANKEDDNSGYTPASEQLSLECFFQKVLNGEVVKFNSDQQKTICRWMKVNKARKMTGHQEAFAELQRELGFAGENLSRELIKALRTKTAKKIASLATIFENARSLKILNKPSSKMYNLHAGEEIEYAPWTDRWMDFDWDLSLKKPFLWDFQNASVPDDLGDHQHERLAVESPEPEAERAEANLKSLRARLGNGREVSPMDESDSSTTWDESATLGTASDLDYGDVNARVAEERGSKPQSVIELEFEGQGPQDKGMGDKESNACPLLEAPTILNINVPKVTSNLAVLEDCGTGAQPKVDSESYVEEESLGDCDTETEYESESESNEDISMADTSATPSGFVVGQEQILRAPLPACDYGDKNLGEGDSETDEEESEEEDEEDR